VEFRRLLEKAHKHAVEVLERDSKDVAATLTLTSEAVANVKSEQGLV
jgi:hypothetical protein